jgi:hypothetical protein
MEKLDLTKKYKSYYTAKTKPELVDIETAQYLAICGKGDPSGQPFADRVTALYTMAYTVKFIFKAQNQDFVVGKLEGLWWFDESKYPGKTISTASADVPRSEWEYRLLIRLPEFVTSGDLIKAKDFAINDKGVELATEVELFALTEGKCVQMLHVGPFASEVDTLIQIGEYIDTHQLAKNGIHHEIYLSDFRKTEPRKLKTILREPVK